MVTSSKGDLFKGVMAFSPGLVIEGPWVGKPRFYISHGKHDRILPIEKCGQDLVRARLAELD